MPSRLISNPGWREGGPTLKNDAPEPVVVPYTELSAELLHAVIESFVLREGTDYGEKEVSLQDKVARVVGQLKNSTPWQRFAMCCAAGGTHG